MKFTVYISVSHIFSYSFSGPVVYISSWLLQPVGCFIIFISGTHYFCWFSIVPWSSVSNWRSARCSRKIFCSGIKFRLRCTISCQHARCQWVVGMQRGPLAWPRGRRALGTFKSIVETHFLDGSVFILVE